MAMRLYVGNLPYTVNSGQLQDLFAPFGVITSANVIEDKFSNRSKGFGFVEFESDDAGREAVAQMNGKEIDGRALRVNEARPMEERAPRSGGFGDRRPSGGGSRGGFRPRN